MPKILFVAGDPSGDQHAAAVARALKEKDPGAEVLAVGGPALKGVADRFLHDLVGESVMGFIEPLKKIPRFRRILHQIIRPAIAEADVVVPTDFFGFNQFTAKSAKAAGKKVLYLVSPQVWASRRGRIETLKKNVDRMLVIFPFEEKLYRDHGVPVTFVGHPYLDRLPEAAADAPMNVEPVIGLLPGSRKGEVSRHLPLFLETADLLAKDMPNLRFILFAAPNLSNAYYDSLIKRHLPSSAPSGHLLPSGEGNAKGFPLPLGEGRVRAKAFSHPIFEIVRDEDLSWRRGLDLALTCSGSATLENALLGVPMVVVYKTSWLTYQLAKRLVRVKHIAMANLLAEKELVPELIQDRAAPDQLAEQARALIRDPARRRALRGELLSLRAKLGGPGFAARAAGEIMSCFRM